MVYALREPECWRFLYADYTPEPAAASKTTGSRILELDDLLFYMSRGNQRELARAKNLKKQGNASHKETGDPRARMESHAEIMRAKQAAAEARKAETKKP